MGIFRWAIISRDFSDKMAAKSRKVVDHLAKMDVEDLVEEDPGMMRDDKTAVIEEPFNTFTDDHLDEEDLGKVFEKLGVKSEDIENKKNEFYKLEFSFDEA